MSLLPLPQVCFEKAQQQQQSQDWQFAFVLGQTAAKSKAHGWAEQALRCYALACHRSRGADKHQTAVLLPYVKLHGTRLKLLVEALTPTTTSSSSKGPQDMPLPAGYSRPSAEQAVGDLISGPSILLGSLLQIIQQVSKWCFAAERRSQLLPLLASLRSSPLLASSDTEQKAALATLQQRFCQQEQQQHSLREPQVHELQPWQEAVQLLFQDCCSGLQYCQHCYSRPLGPARYSLARELFKLGRQVTWICVEFCLF